VRAEAPTPAPVVEPEPTPVTPRRPTQIVNLPDDVPSADDLAYEGSELVGAQVVQDLLGGRVIEENGR
jgi:hypothetical protein